MSGTIRKLFGASLALTLLALSASYFGFRLAEAKKPGAENLLTQQFAADPGDGWMLAGGFLMLIALAVAFAAAMLWMQERKDGG